jgi:hypothetical protein
MKLGTKLIDRINHIYKYNNEEYVASIVKETSDFLAIGISKPGVSRVREYYFTNGSEPCLIESYLFRQHEEGSVLPLMTRSMLSIAFDCKPTTDKKLLLCQ